MNPRIFAVTSKLWHVCERDAADSGLVTSVFSQLLWLFAFSFSPSQNLMFLNTPEHYYEA